jgi:hypothetical protein
MVIWTIWLTASVKTENSFLVLFSRFQAQNSRPFLLLLDRYDTDKNLQSTTFLNESVIHMLCTPSKPYYKIFQPLDRSLFKCLTHFMLTNKTHWRESKLRRKYSTEDSRWQKDKFGNKFHFHISMAQKIQNVSIRIKESYTFGRFNQECQNL